MSNKDNEEYVAKLYEIGMQEDWVAAARKEWPQIDFTDEGYVKCPIGLDKSPTLCSAGYCSNLICQGFSLSRIRKIVSEDIGIVEARKVAKAFEEHINARGKCSQCKGTCPEGGGRGVVLHNPDCPVGALFALLVEE